ncbi:glycosyltransferase, partial [Acinetobacter baumannii]
SDNFWSDQKLSSVFDSKTPCNFNIGVIVIDLDRWERRRLQEKDQKLDEYYGSYNHC